MTDYTVIPNKIDANSTDGVTMSVTTGNKLIVLNPYKGSELTASLNPAIPGTVYSINAGTVAEVTLPAVSNIGESYIIAGVAGGWKVTATGPIKHPTITIPLAESYISYSLSSGTVTDNVSIISTDTNKWSVVSYSGTLTAGYNTVYDSFSGTSVSATLWTVTGAVTEGSGVINLAAAPSSYKGVVGKQTYNGGVSVTFKQAIVPQDTAGGNGLGFGSAVTGANSCFVAAFDNAHYKCDGTATTFTIDTNPHDFRIDWLANGTMKYYIDGTLVYTGATVYSNLPIAIYCYSKNVTCQEVDITTL